MPIILQAFQKLIDISEFQFNQLISEQLQDRQTNIEHKSSSKCEQIVPDSQAQTHRKAVQETSHEPLMNPHLIRYHFLLEMEIKIIYEFLKELFKYWEILHQNWKLGFKKAWKAIEWNFLLRFLKDGVEEPEGLLLVSTGYTEYKSDKEIHTLAVAYFWLVYRVGFQNIL